MRRQQKLGAILKTPSHYLQNLLVIYIVVTVVLFVVEYVHVQSTDIVWWFFPVPGSVDSTPAFVSSIIFALIAGVPATFAIWILAGIRDQVANRG